MDTSDYLPMFLAEGREHLQNLNLALVRIEHNAADGESINEIFRIAHSLKGMSATMGFSRMAGLTHEMENVLELLRQSEAGLPAGANDVLFECLDALEGLTNEIEASGAETSDPAPVVVKLKALVDAAPGEAAQAAAVPAAAAPAETAVAGFTLPAGLDTTGLKRAVLSVDPDCDMPSVRIFLACQALAGHADIVDSQPTFEAIEAGEETPTTLVLLLTPQSDDSQLRRLLRSQEGILEAVISDAEEGAAPAPVASESDPAVAVVGPPAGTPPPAPGTPVTAAPHPNRRQTVRIDAERLDSLMHLMGEMVVQRTRLESIAAKGGDPTLVAAVADLTRVAQALQNMVMQVRMVPVESVFMRFPRMVRDLATKLDKQIELIIEGEETELDRTVVEALGDPLVHLVRNSIDHGIESPEKRTAAGKTPTGTLRLSAEHAGGEVVITVEDDGAGVIPANVGKVAVKRGLLAPEDVDGLSVEDAIELLFAPGFSTAAVATDLSGRGVGMDAVRNMVRGYGGEVTMTSKPGQGTKAQLRLPLTLAILPALLVEVDGAPFALPLDRVEQAIRVADFPLRGVKGQPAITLRDRVLPLYDLAGCLGGRDRVDPQQANAVVVRAKDRSIGLMVKRLIGQQELVTRPLPAVVDGAYSAVSGGAVLGDGQIALIVDCDQVVPAGKAA